MDFSNSTWKSWAAFISRAPGQDLGYGAARETHQPQHLGNPLSRLGSTQGSLAAGLFLYHLYLQDKILDLSSPVFDNPHSSPLSSSLPLCSLCCSAIGEATGHVFLENKALSS